MFGSVGGMEILLVLVLALLLFGPRKLPQVGRTVGRALSEFRRATTDFKTNLEREVAMDELRSAEREVSDAVEDARSVARGTIRAPDAVTGETTQGTGSTDARPPSDPTTEAPDEERS
jgi:Tat protein translocase TatB subunit